jgi:hypothetical protein
VCDWIGLDGVRACKLDDAAKVPVTSMAPAAVRCLHPLCVYMYIYVFLTAEHVLRLSFGTYSILLDWPSCSCSSTSTRIDRFILPDPTLF